MVGMGVGVAVGVAVGVLVGVAVLVGMAVAVGNGVVLGTGAGVGADAGAQADSIRLTSKNTSTVRFIVRVLLWRSSRPTARGSAARGASVASGACRLQPLVSPLFVFVFSSCHDNNNCHNDNTNLVRR